MAQTLDWISVKDELPVDSDAYLVTWKCTSWKQTAYIGICEWDAENERWLTEDMYQFKLYSGIDILAWADPEPYKENIED